MLCLIFKNNLMVIDMNDLQLSKKRKLLLYNNTPYKFIIKIIPKKLNSTILHYTIPFMDIEYELVEDSLYLNEIKQQFKCISFKIRILLNKRDVKTKIFNNKGKRIQLDINDINYLLKYKKLECHLEHERICKNGICIFDIVQINVI